MRYCAHMVFKIIYITSIISRSIIAISTVFSISVV